MVTVSSIVERIRAEERAIQGWSGKGYSKLTRYESIFLEDCESRARHGWEFRSRMQRAGQPLVWVDTVGKATLWENSSGTSYVVIGADDEYKSL